MDFDLLGNDYIQLNTLLKLLGLVESGGEANSRIVSGEVQVNGLTELQKRKKLRQGDTVDFNKKQIKII